MAGIALENRGWTAPWLKIKMFCTPRGRISPRARVNPCIAAVNKVSLSF
jgi:hypothetical protein